MMDFSVNANGTLNLLEATRQYVPKSPFIFTSTNKVYGDTPNHLPLVEQESRWEIDSNHPINQVFGKICRLTKRYIVCLGHQKLRRIFLFRNIGAILGCGLPVFGVDASGDRITLGRSYTAFWHI
jgi:CDP-paratose 2-epimerase